MAVPHSSLRRGFNQPPPLPRETILPEAKETGIHKATTGIKEADGKHRQSATQKTKQNSTDLMLTHIFNSSSQCVWMLIYFFTRFWPYHPCLTVHFAVLRRLCQGIFAEADSHSSDKRKGVCLKGLTEKAERHKRVAQKGFSN